MDGFPEISFSSSFGPQFPFIECGPECQDSLGGTILCPLPPMVEGELFVFLKFIAERPPAFFSFSMPDNLGQPESVAREPARSGNGKLTRNLGVEAGDSLAEKAAFFRRRRASTHFDDNAVASLNARGNRRGSLARAPGCHGSRGRIHRSCF